jgi:uncharacterized protein (TIGR03435 family)
MMPAVFLLFASTLASTLALGQTAFEVASVKPSAPVQPGARVYFGPPRGGPGTSDPIQITWTYATLKGLLTTAYDVKNYQVNGPAWLDSERYDIVAKVPAGATKEQVNTMWQNLLAERFGVVLHREPKEFQVDELVIAKGGHKLKESKDDPAAPQSPDPPSLKDGGLSAPGFVSMIKPVAGGANVHSVARDQPISKLTATLSGNLKHPVLDKTALTGRYDFELDYRIDLAAPPVGSPSGDTASDPSPSLDDAVRQQLGLRLVPGKAILDVLVIDKAQKMPTTN